LDEVYTAGLMYPSRQMSRIAPRPTLEQGQAVAEIIETQTKGGADEAMLLQTWNGKLLAEEFHLPAMEVEIERAVEQVEKSIKDREQLMKEKKEIEKATRPPDMSEEEAEKIAEEKLKQDEKEKKI
jgi:glyceraldehyde-3-phosphate dehydrogenase/erythrose-4-phosphate dehydrogenase